MTEPRPAPLSALPIDDALPELLARLSKSPSVVLQAPPGAGKTTRVPLALLSEPWARSATILMLEPRRVAARAAAARMAQTLGEPVGETVGYRIRDEARIGPRTRIEVVTEGILTRRLQGDPELSGVACVIFDEFHERSIHADLGLALCLEIQTLREDLRLLVMSATLDGQAVAALMGADRPAPIVTSEGRSHPVETRWLDAPIKLAGGGGRGRGPRGRATGPRLEHAAADLTRRALTEAPGDALLFLPGAREIRGAVDALSCDAPPDLDLLPLYGE
ncbi:MAG: DEAD/DEAH box helicase, partial [Pseudomonadota bacterium]